ncbi:hypothetical protein [Lacticaseibacillus paracasei]
MTRKIKVFEIRSSVGVDSVNLFLKLHPQAKLSYTGSDQCSFEALVIADYEDDEGNDEQEAKQ